MFEPKRFLHFPHIISWSVQLKKKKKKSSLAEWWIDIIGKRADIKRIGIMRKYEAWEMINWNWELWVIQEWWQLKGKKKKTAYIHPRCIAPAYAGLCWSVLAVQGSHHHYCLEHNYQNTDTKCCYTDRNRPK